MLKNIFKRKLLLVVSIIFLSGVFFLLDWMTFLRTPLIMTSQDYIFPSGSSVRVLARDLKHSGQLKRAFYFELLAYIKGYAKHLQAGEYRFLPGTTPEALLRQIAEGRVLWHSITFVEGWTFIKIREVLDRNEKISHETIDLPVVWVMALLKLPGLSPEGLFYPATYRYTRGMSDKTILLQAFHLLEKHLLEAWENRAAGLPYQIPYEALIAASIIEKETHNESERTKIAGIIVKRLQKNMRLQMDPTVIYAIHGDEDMENFKLPLKLLKKEDLQTESLYNTYLYSGLPSTPICMPSLASLQAALHPLIGEDLYFVARRDGSHQFSQNYSEQLRAIAHVDN